MITSLKIKSKNLYAKHWEYSRKIKHLYRVAEKKINSDLCIVDKTDKSFLSVAKVLSLGKDNKIRYEYTGTDKRQSSIPCGLCTDDVGHVLITDFDNQNIHILDKDGNFLQYLLTGEQGLRKPVSINVDSEGNAWVGQQFGDMKIVKYLTLP